MHQTKYKHISSLVNDKLDILKKTLEVKLPEESGILKSVIESVFSAEGKYIRPTLIFLLEKAITPQPTYNGEFLKLAVITELFHTASLIHDDFLDEALTRRGRKTTHLEWDNKTAVITGDFLFSKASCLLSELNNTEIANVYSKTLLDLCLGELEQVNYRWKTDEKSANIQNYIHKSIKKTANLFSAATKSVWLIYPRLSPSAEKWQSNQKALFDFGLNLGIAFQIVDDLMDFTIDSKNSGKDKFNDLKNGIFTAPVIYGLNPLSPLKGEQKLGLNKLLLKLQNDNDNQELINEIMELLEKSGAFDKSWELVNEYILKAQKSIKFLADSEYKEALIDLTSFVASRKK